MNIEVIGNALTAGFCLILSVFFIMASIERKKTADSPFVLYAPTLLTTVGILGTFTGVVFGLWHFDVNNIDQSIPGLLSGLKTAFITSVVGMAFSVVFKLLDVKAATPEISGEVPEEITDKMVFEQLTRQSAGIEEVSKAICGDDEATLVGQLKLLRSDARDDANRHIKQMESHKEEFVEFRIDLQDQLENFAEMLSKSATEQVIEALQNVIKDFNQNLTEQFGENFKQLNSAVNDLIKWQENYRVQLDEMSKQYSLGVEAISQTEASVAEIGKEVKEIPLTMDELKTVVFTARAQTDELNEHLAAFADMRDKAIEAVPEIKNQMTLMANEVSDATKSASSLILEGCQAANESLITGAEDFNNRVERTNAALTSTSDVLDKNSEKIKETLDDAAKDFTSNMSDMVSKLSDSSSKLSEEFKQATEGVINGIDSAREAFSKNLESSFNTFKEQSNNIVLSFDTQSQNVNSRIETTVTQMSDRQIQASEAAFEAVKSAISRSVGDFEQSLNSQISALDTALETELQRTISSMGQKLAGITGQFADDYSQLTNQMVRVINQAESVSKQTGV